MGYRTFSLTQERLRQLINGEAPKFKVIFGKWPPDTQITGTTFSPAERVITLTLYSQDWPNTPEACHPLFLNMGLQENVKKPHPEK